MQLSRKNGFVGRVTKCHRSEVWVGGGGLCSEVRVGGGVSAVRLGLGGGSAVRLGLGGGSAVGLGLGGGSLQ